jgi:ribosomal protein L32
MAVPKKRTSKTKTKTRRTIWKKKAERQANKALSIAKSVLKNLLNDKNK